MTEMSHIPYDRRIVAFIDILGFKALVAALSSDRSFQAKLHRALREIKTYKQLAGDASTAQQDIEVSVFSD